MTETQTTSAASANNSSATDGGAPVFDHEGNEWPAGMKIVNGHLAKNLRSQGMLQSPNELGYIHLAGEVERPSLVRRRSARIEGLLASLKAAARTLATLDGVQRADVFDAFVVPPGVEEESRRLLDEGGYDVHVAQFDIAVLVECASVEVAKAVRATPAFAALERLLTEAATFVHCVVASNPKRIAEVDKERDGVFLFNYFFAANVPAEANQTCAAEPCRAREAGDRGRAKRFLPGGATKTQRAAGIDILLGVWEYTAGWWTAKANLTNSTPLLPVEGEASQYSLINHCRWDRAVDVFPSLIFRPSLRKFVLDNFEANAIVSMPMLYHLA